MPSFQELIRQLRDRRAETIAALASVLARTLAALGWHQSEAQRILALTAETRGQLRSILLGVPDEYIDMEPAPGEWSVRQALEHAYFVDGRYMDACLQAVDRFRSNLSMEQPADGRPRPEPERLPGRLEDVQTKLQARRYEVIERLASLPDADLAAPIVYRAEQVDVRYRLHLISAHEQEHTGQVARALRAVGFEQSEAQMILGQAEIARGVLQGMLIGLPDELMFRAPPAGLSSVEAILARAVEEEATLVGRIGGAVAV